MAISINALGFRVALGRKASAGAHFLRNLPSHVPKAGI
jgi:hypothetical protein